MIDRSFDKAVTTSADSSECPPISEIGAEDLFNETVLDALPVGVVVLDRFGYVVKYNRFEEQLARRRRQEVIGRHFFEDVARCTNVPEIRGSFDEHIESNTLATELDFRFDLPFQPHPRDVRLRLRSFDVGGRPFGVLVVEDISLPKELERQRQRLLDVMVHDLRNPLQGILGYASLLREAGDGLGEARMARALETIEKSAESMEALLRGTLEEMRGERRAWQKVNLHALALSTLGNLLPIAQRREVSLIYGGVPFDQPLFPERAIEMRGAVEQLASLVQNLVANAVKYARRSVRVELREEPGEPRKIVLEVADDGRGIAPEDLEKIFEEGYQAADSLPGAGIGLFSVRRAVETHGGRIEVRSELGKGSVFRAEMPAAPTESRSSAAES